MCRCNIPSVRVIIIKRLSFLFEILEFTKRALSRVVDTGCLVPARLR